MSDRKRKNVVVPLSSSSSSSQEEDEEEEEEEEEDDVDDEEEEEDDEVDNDDDDDEEEDEDEEEEVYDDDYDDEEERDVISISSSEDGKELSEEEADRNSLDDDSEAAPATEANCDRVIKLLQGARDLHVLKLEECKAYLRKHGLRVTGTKEICIQRIQEHWRIKDGKGEKLYPRSSFTINCTGDVCQGDVVLFTQRVYEKFDIVTRVGKPIGKRTIAGRVVKESYGAAKQQHTFTVEILWSKGLKKLPPLFPLLIKGRNLYRLKTFRQKWKDERKRVKVLAEKHKRGALARYIRATTIAQSFNKGSRLHKRSCKMESPLKKLRNGGTESSTKAEKQVFSRGKASTCRRLRTNETAKTKEQSGLKWKRECCLKRTPAKRQRNKEPLSTRTQQPNNESSARHFLHAHPHENRFPTHHPIIGPHHCRDGPSYVIGGAVHPFSKYEVGCTSTASGVSRNTMAVPPLRNQAFNDNHFFHAGFEVSRKAMAVPPLRDQAFNDNHFFHAGFEVSRNAMAVPPLRNQAFNDNHFFHAGFEVSRNTMAVLPLRNQAFNDNHLFHAGFDRRLSSHSLSQVHIARQLNAAPPAVQSQVHMSGKLPCSMPGCKDTGAKSCVGSFCWKCCKSTGWKCPRHKLP